MNLTSTAQVSVDGVMQGPGGPEEDEPSVFERRGWAHFDDEAGTAMDEIHKRADAFLFGGVLTRSSPAPGEHGTIRATARSERRCTRGRNTWHRHTMRPQVVEHDRPRG